LGVLQDSRSGLTTILLDEFGGRPLDVNHSPVKVVSSQLIARLAEIVSCMFGSVDDETAEVLPPQNVSVSAKSPYFVNHFASISPV
jgi:hypothetical protein